jgi:hypothetical protein
MSEAHHVTVDDAIDLTKILSVPDFAAKYPNLGTAAAWRTRVFQSDRNGLDEYGAVLRRAGKVFLVEPRVLAWFIAGKG